MIKTINKNILLMMLVIMLMIPAIQQLFKIISEKPLMGAVIPAQDTVLSSESWFSGRFQLIKENYVNENFGFRKFFVRLNNQVAFSIYNKAKANGVIVGKENYLFEESYILEYLGEDYIGRDSISNILKKIKFIQDTLFKQNKVLLIVYAPSKAYLFPDKFPNNYSKKKSLTNYESFAELSKKMEVNHIDFNSYFIKEKSSTKFPLFSKYGIHWSVYSSSFVTDSIVKYIERIRGVNLPDQIVKGCSVDKSKGSDNDIADGMNLLFELKDQMMCYPDFYFLRDSSFTRPSLLVISDSFYWIIYSQLSSAFKNDHFWYYNREVYPENTYSPHTVENVILSDEVSKHDIIVVLLTAPSLRRIGWGFIDNMYNLYNGKNEKSDRISYYINQINNNGEWRDKIISQSKESGLPLDSMIKLNAIWMVEHENK